MKTLEQVLRNWPSVLSNTFEEIIDDILDFANANWPNRDEYTNPQILVSANDVIRSIYDDLAKGGDPNYVSEDVIQLIYQATQYTCSDEQDIEPQKEKKPSITQAYKEILENQENQTLMVGYPGNASVIIGKGNNLISIKPYELKMLLKQLQLINTQGI
ncbi:MAG: hypothetical protein RSC49_04695 [Clostridium sp.]